MWDGIGAANSLDLISRGLELRYHPDLQIVGFGQVIMIVCKITHQL
jgi:hypothetical protein